MTPRSSLGENSDLSRYDLCIWATMPPCLTSVWGLTYLGMTSKYDLLWPPCLTSVWVLTYLGMTSVYDLPVGGSHQRPDRTPEVRLDPCPALHSGQASVLDTKPPESEKKQGKYMRKTTNVWKQAYKKAKNSESSKYMWDGLLLDYLNKGLVRSPELPRTK